MKKRCRLEVWAKIIDRINRDGLKDCSKGWFLSFSIFCGSRMNTCYLQVLGALVRYQLKRSSTLSQAFLNCLVSCLFFVLLSGASGSFQVWVDEGFVFWRRVSSTPCTFWQPGAFVCLLHVPSKGAAGPPMARDPTPMPLRLSRCFEFGSFGLEVHQIPLQSRPGHRGLYGRARLALSPSHVQFAVLRLVS